MEEKRIITGVLTLIMAICSATFGLFVGMGIQEDKCRKDSYDVNEDGEVDILDLLILQKHLIEEGEKNERQNNDSTN